MNNLILASAALTGINEESNQDIEKTVSDTSDLIQNSVDKFGIFKINPLLSKAISAAVVIIIAFVIYNVIRHIIKKCIVESNSSRITSSHVTNVKLIGNVLKTLLILFSIIIILDIFGVNITGIVTGLGVVGAVAGLAAQDMIKDLIAGATIAAEKYFVIGDVIECQNYKGVVTSLSMRSVKLRMIDGAIVTIQNHLVDKARIVSTENSVCVQLPYDLERSKSFALIDTIVEEIKKIPEVTSAKSAGISSFGSSAIYYMILFYCSPEAGPRTTRAANNVIIHELDKAGVEIPFDQLDVHTL